MEKLRAFQTGKIGKLEIKNRLVRSATFEYMGTETGEVNDALVRLYRNLAEGGVGLIITGFASVHPEAYCHPQQMRVHDDCYIEGLQRIPDAVHELDNGCRIILQLNHTGRQQISPELADWTVAPSAVYDELFQRTPRELTPQEIEEIIDCFAESIRRAKDARFDGVQLHAAHGWLLSTFLSPRTNKRTDAYGGSTENRVRILDEIFKRARSMVGEAFPILVKLSSEDYLPGGINLEEGKRVAERLSKIGFSALEISGGMWESMTRDEKELGWKPVPIPEARVDIKTKDQEAYFWANAREIRKVVEAPIILVGGLRSLEIVEKVLGEGSVDFCSMARPFIREPDFPSKWLAGEGKGETQCISCNRCMPRPERSLECRVGEEVDEGEGLEIFPYFRNRQTL